MDRIARTSRPIHDLLSRRWSPRAFAGRPGLYMHQMAGFDVEKAQRVFAVPEQFEPAAAIALGYLGDPAGLPERYREGEARPRTRKPLTDFVFAGQWGQASPLVVPE